MTQENKKAEYIIRKEGQGTFGLGEVVIPGVTLFRVGFYNLTKEELNKLTTKPHIAKGLVK